MPLHKNGQNGLSRVSNTTVKWHCVAMLMFYGKGDGKVLLRASCIAMVTNHTKRLTMLITNMEKKCLDGEILRDECRAPFRHWYYGCMFPGSSLLHLEMTNGNALCSLMSFILQHVTLTRSYKVTY